MPARSAAHVLIWLACLLVATSVHAQGPTCNNGVPGVQSEVFEDICCDPKCRQCGGPQCISANRPIGLGEPDCCNSGIRNTGNDCATTGEGPCVIFPRGAENQCLDLTNTANRCSVNEDGLMDLSVCGITDQDVEAGDLAACLDAAGRQTILDLSLARNDLTTLPQTIFNSLANLGSLSLFGDFSRGLVTLPSGIFDSLTKLRSLRLEDNDLTTLPPTIFNSLTILEDLRLDGNGLVTLPPGIFDSLTELTALSVSRNDLTTLPPTIFTSLTKLNFLGISNNELLTTLPPTIFNSLTALTFLVLSNSGLVTLPSGIFDSLVELTFLSLRGNSLTTLPTDVFNSLTKLGSLNLNGNVLVTLPSGIFDSLTQLGSLDVRENPDLQCLPTVPPTAVSQLRVDTVGTECGCFLPDV
ncbi:unnamed protein product, partial [Ectocarpus sp. 12 AP-2014]